MFCGAGERGDFFWAFACVQNASVFCNTHAAALGAAARAGERYKKGRMEQLQMAQGQDFERWHVLRHARPLVQEGICYGRYNMPADAAATRAAAQAFARHWLNANRCDMAVGAAAAGAGAGDLQVQLWCSPLQRCQQLAHALQALLADAGVGVQMQTKQALAEMDFGRWEGQPWQALPADEWERWMGNFADYRVGGGESTRAILQRVHGAARDTAAALAADAALRIVWVSHAGVICALHWLQSQGRLLQEQQAQQATCQSSECIPVPQTASEWPQHAACGFGLWRAMT